MNREIHVRFWESAGVQSPRATQQGRERAPQPLAHEVRPLGEKPSIARLTRAHEKENEHGKRTEKNRRCDPPAGAPMHDVPRDEPDRYREHACAKTA